MLKIKHAIAGSSDQNLLESYDKPLFENIIMSLMPFIDMAINSYDWISNNKEAQ